VAIRLVKIRSKHDPRPAYLPMFAVMNPTGYESWKHPHDNGQKRRSFLR
jgi:hypothetical protein